MFDPMISVNREVYMTDRQAAEKNIATNGRLFCLMVFALCLVAFACGYGVRFARLAALAAAPVGLACIVDQMKAGPVRFALTILSYSVAALAALVFLLMIG